MLLVLVQFMLFKHGCAVRPRHWTALTSCLFTDKLGGTSEVPTDLCCCGDEDRFKINNTSIIGIHKSQFGSNLLIQAAMIYRKYFFFIVSFPSFFVMEGLEMLPSHFFPTSSRNNLFCLLTKKKEDFLKLNFFHHNRSMRW